MKGKRYTTEDKIRILREADGGKTVQEVCRERNIAEPTFYRWKRTYWLHLRGRSAQRLRPPISAGCRATKSRPRD